MKRRRVSTVTLRPEVRRRQPRHVAVVLGLAAVLLIAPSCLHALRTARMLFSFDGGESKLEIARHAVHRYATTSYLGWRARHPVTTCPRLEELVPLTPSRDDRDPWGNPYLIACASGAHHHVWVWSLGEDALPGTSDDVWSDR